jgi:hypothetical protein
MGRQAQFAAFECGRRPLSAEPRLQSACATTEERQVWEDTGLSPSKDFTGCFRQPPTFVRQIQTAADSLYPPAVDVQPPGSPPWLTGAALEGPLYPQAGVAASVPRQCSTPQQHG